MKSIDLVTVRDPESPITEVYKTLRTNIKFASFNKKIKTIVITSTGSLEGKSTVASNLGVVMAQAGNKVVILEGNLRNPSVHYNFMMTNTVGLTNILIDNSPFQSVVFNTGIENLDIIPCGTRPPNPAELLDSDKMRKLLEDLKELYDYILIDTPPVAMMTDAALLASAADGTLLVVSSGEAVIEGAEKAKEQLKNVGANMLGVVLNKVKAVRSGKYHKYYSHYSKKSPKPKPDRKLRYKKGTAYA